LLVSLTLFNTWGNILKLPFRKKSTRNGIENDAILSDGYITLPRLNISLGIMAQSPAIARRVFPNTSLLLDIPKDPRRRGHLLF